MVAFPRVEGSDYRLTVGGFSGTAGDTLRLVDIRSKILEREIVHTPPYHSGNAGDTLRLALGSITVSVFDDILAEFDKSESETNSNNNLMM